MKNLFLVLALLCFTFQLSAQENVLSSGSEGTSTTGKVTYSVGLIHYKEATGTGGSTSVGTQIPYEVTQVLNLQQFSNATAKVFPNPTDNVLNIHLTSLDDLNYQLIDLSGRNVTSGTLNQLESQIQLNALESSIYILDIIKDSNIIKSFKISKK